MHHNRPPWAFPVRRPKSGPKQSWKSLRSFKTDCCETPESVHRFEIVSDTFWTPGLEGPGSGPGGRRRLL